MSVRAKELDMYAKEMWREQDPKGFPVMLLHVIDGADRHVVIYVDLQTKLDKYHNTFTGLDQA